MRQILYLGLEVPEHLSKEQVVHCPLIKIVARPKDDPAIIEAYTQFQDYTHVIFTSKSGVAIFMEYARHFGMTSQEIQSKVYLSVGTQTAAALAAHDIKSLVAEEETAEGVVTELRKLDLSGASVLWPHSGLSRPIISTWLEQNHIRNCSVVLYDTIANLEKVPDLKACDEIVFTSPSTVDAFLKLFGTLPKDKTLTCIGPVTQAYLGEKRLAVPLHV